MGKNGLEVQTSGWPVATRTDGGVKSQVVFNFNDQNRPGWLAVIEGSKYEKTCCGAESSRGMRDFLLSIFARSSSDFAHKIYAVINCSDCRFAVSG